MQRILRANPDNDVRFVSLVYRLSVAASGPSDLQRLLRATFPVAAVHRRELSGEGADTWYVYRDGSWTDDR